MRWLRPTPTFVNKYEPHVYLKPPFITDTQKNILLRTSQYKSNTDIAYPIKTHRRGHFLFPDYLSIPDIHKHFHPHIITPTFTTSFQFMISFCDDVCSIFLCVWFLFPFFSLLLYRYIYWDDDDDRLRRRTTTQMMMKPIIWLLQYFYWLWDHFWGSIFNWDHMDSVVPMPSSKLKV